MMSDGEGPMEFRQPTPNNDFSSTLMNFKYEPEEGKDDQFAA